MLTDKPRIPIKELILFGLWPSPIKVWLYRLRGYRVGRGVSIGFGSVITGDQVEIGDRVSVGFFTIIRGREIKLGAHVQIGSTTFLDTPYLEIGEGSRINEQVFVGGLQFPDSRFVLGRNCQVMQMSFINPARSIVVGDDSGIGGHCLLFGHTSWLSQFEGYEVSFDSIEIGSSVSLAWRVFVLPGAKIGDGSVIGANSLVHNTIPERCLAVGFPARVVAKAPKFPREVPDEEKVTMLRAIILEMLDYFRGAGLACDGDGDVVVVSRPASAWWRRRQGPWRMRVQYDPAGAEPLDPAGFRPDCLVSLGPIPDTLRADWTRAGTVWIDIAAKQRNDRSNPLAEEVAQYLKRYGVRLLRERT